MTKLVYYRWFCLGVNMSQKVIIQLGIKHKMFCRQTFEVWQSCMRNKDICKCDMKCINICIVLKEEKLQTAAPGAMLSAWALISSTSKREKEGLREQCPPCSSDYPSFAATVPETVTCESA